ISAAQRLGESFPAGTSDPVLAVTRSDDAAQIESLAESLGAVSGVTSATAVPPVDGVGQVRLVLEAEPGSDEAAQTVEAVRDAAGGEVYVTGGEASAVDA